MNTINTAIALMIYNRPANTLKLINKLNEFNYNKLYVVADGPKPNNKDKLKVSKTRKLIEKNIKKKNFFKIYANENLGLKNRVVSGLDEIFKKEKKLIILEDDCIPSIEFFEFVEINLKNFENNKKISSILGTNYLTNLSFEKNFLFTKYFHPWGWATWKDRWIQKKFNFKFLLDKNHKKKLIKYLFSYRAYLYWTRRIKLIKKGKLNSWANLWTYYNFILKKKHIVPKYNLVDNIGINLDSTNTQNLHYEYHGYSQLKKIKFKKYKIEKLNENNFDNMVEDVIFSKNFYNRVKWIIYKINNKIKIIFNEK